MSGASVHGTPYEGFVQNGGVNIHFKAAGNGPLLVLVHGFPDNADSFQYQSAELSKSYTVVTPTLRGYPPSDVPDEPDAYILSTVVKDFLALLDHFETEKAFIGGHDFGGAAVQTLALLHPERVAGLIIINSPLVPAFNNLVNLDEEQQKLSEYTIHYIKYESGDDKNEKYIVRNIRDPTRREEIQGYLASSPMHGMFNYYKKNYPGPPYGQWQDTSSMIYMVPTLILWGTEEEYFSPKILSSVLTLFGKGVRLVTLHSAGHWSFRDRPNAVNREIRSWLEELRSTNND